MEREKVINNRLKQALSDKGLRETILSSPLSFLKDMGINVKEGLVPLTLATPNSNNVMLGAYRP